MNLLLTDGDVVFKGGRLQTVTGLEENTQKLQAHLNGEQGEWFLDQSWFIPWLTVVFVKTPDLLVIQTVIKDAIRSMPWLQALVSYDQVYDSTARSLEISFTVRATTGEVSSFDLTTFPDGSAAGFLFSLRRR